MALENYHKTGQITHPKETTPPFADPSSHYWEDISRKVSIKQNGHFNYSRKEKIKFLKKKKKKIRWQMYKKQAKQRNIQL